MPRKKKTSAAQTPTRCAGSFAPDIPPHDFLEDGPLDDTWNRQQVVGTAADCSAKEGFAEPPELQR